MISYVQNRRLLAITLLSLIGSVGFSFTAHAKTPAPAASPTPAADDDRINVDTIKQNYWAKGNEDELHVVRNRLYSKAGRAEVGIYYGWTSTNPFLTVRNLVGTLGYHFNEYFGVNILAMRYLVSSSSALITFQQQTGATVSGNDPKNYLGGEVSLSPLYGKLSVMGKQIIYFDLHLLAGFGRTSTESGTYATPEVGIGQQIYLNSWLSLRGDYRLTYYDETVLVKPVASTGPVAAGTNGNYNNIVMVGLTALFP
jgi:outer membrane beta-barrel protein